MNIKGYILDNNDDDHEDSYEDWQYEYSLIRAENFIEDFLIPDLDEFDFESTDKNYVEGVATFMMFCKLISILGDMGYTAQDLKEQIDLHIDSNSNITLH